MYDITRAFARAGTTAPMCGFVMRGRTLVSAAGLVPSAHTAVVTLIDARNAAQGGPDAWSPPV